jgi:hypothetical protein
MVARRLLLPRAAAFEKRFALCVAWGANHDWGAVQRRRLEREGEGERPVRVADPFAELAR